MRSFLLVFFLAGMGACGSATNEACACQIVDDIPGETQADSVRDEETTASAKTANENFADLKTRSDADVQRFLHYVQDVYLSPKEKTFSHLLPSEAAKLIGYAIGEASTSPAPVNVFAPGFSAAVEQWVVRYGIYGGPLTMPRGPAEAEMMWRRIEEGARGFYDVEMQAAYGSVADNQGPASIEEWFAQLSDAEKRTFLAQAAKAGVARNDGSPFTIRQFQSVSILLDAELDREGKSPKDRRDFIRHLAAGETVSASEE